MVFIKVKTNFNKSKKANVGSFAGTSSNAKEIDNLYYALYQALIYPMITTEAVNPKTGIKGDIILDVTHDPKFMASGVTVGSGTSAIVGTGEYVNGASLNKNAPGFNDHIVKAFTDLYPAYKTDYFMVFTFNESVPTAKGYVTGNVHSTDTWNATKGRWDSVFQKRVNLYREKHHNTLNHETLHGLQLRHTHKEGSLVLDPEQAKYGFEHASVNGPKATYNIMSYNIDVYFTWQWQWLIMKSTL